MAPVRTAALAAALFVGVTADADTRQPRLRGAAPAVAEAEVPADTDAEELWRAGHTGVRVGPCGVHVGHTGVRGGPGGAHIGHSGMTVGPCGDHIGHTGATWRRPWRPLRPWRLDEVGGAANKSTLDPEADLAQIASSEQALWGHISHTSVGYRRGWGGWGRGGHIGHTSATWGHPWLLEQVNESGDELGDKESTPSVASSADTVANDTNSLWGHFSHTSIGYRRGWGGWGRGCGGWGGGWGRGGHIGHTSATWGHPWMFEVINKTGDELGDKADNVANETDSLWGHVSHTGATWGRRGLFGPRGGHIGHTSATWGRPWMLDQVNQKGDEAGDKVDQDNKESSVVDETESFWAHVSHTGATWGRRGWFGPRGGHIGHTSATWGHPWMLDEVNQTVQAEKNLTDDFWVHVGHTGATWGRFGGAGHVGHTSATWGHPWMLDEQAATPTEAGNNTNTNSSEDVFPGANDEFWLLVGPEGASVTKERPAVLSAVPATPDDETAGAKEAEQPSVDDDQLEAFWAHVSHTGARWGRVGVWGPRYGHVGHTSATWGRPFR